MLKVVSFKIGKFEATIVARQVKLSLAMLAFQVSASLSPGCSISNPEPCQCDLEGMSPRRYLGPCHWCRRQSSRLLALALPSPSWEQV